MNGKESVVYSTCIETNRSDELPDRLGSAGAALTEILNQYQPAIVAVETLFFNKNVKTAIGVAQARGMVLYLAKNAGCEVLELSPQQVKIAVTGHGASDKQSVYSMIQRLVHKVPENVLDDEYDAIAVAITALAHHR
jgi:crossover junction endodeoxyribonuclease RuvC